MSPKPPGTRLPGNTLPRVNQKRDHALDPEGVDQNMRFLAQKVASIPQVRGDQEPQVELLVSQEDNAGTLRGVMTVIVRDVGDNFDGFVRFAVFNGPGEFVHDDPTDTGVWNTTDSTLPYTKTADLNPKHSTIIAVAVPYRTFSEPDTVQWVIKQHVYDADWDAELASAALVGFDTDGYVTVGLTGDEDAAKHYVNVTIADTLAAATPGDPSASSKDGTLTGRVGTIKFDGTGGTVAKQAAMGKMVGVKVVCENAEAIVNPQVFGSFYKRRGDSQTIPPRVTVIGERSGNTVTVTLEVDDPSLASAEPEWDDGNLAGTWSTVWDDETNGDPGVDEQYSRIIDVDSPDGLASRFAWRLPWTDELGNTQYIGDEIDLARLESETRSIKFGHANFMPLSSATTYEIDAFELWPTTLDTDTRFIGIVTLPKGVTITGFAAGLFRETSSDIAAIGLYRIDEEAAGGTEVAIATHPGTGWTVEPDSASEVVGDDYDYVLSLVLKAVASAKDARFRFVEITYTRPSYREVY